MRRQYTGLSMAPKRRAGSQTAGGRGAFPEGRSRGTTRGGPPGSENADMSNESGVGNAAAVNPRFPGFLHLRRGAITDGATEKGSRTGFWTSPRCHVGREAVKRAPHGAEVADEASERSR